MLGSDTGTHDSLIEASTFVQTIEQRQGYKVACLEEIAYVKGWIDKNRLLSIVESLSDNSYSMYLKKLLKNH